MCPCLNSKSSDHDRISDSPLGRLQVSLLKTLDSYSSTRRPYSIFSLFLQFCPRGHLSKVGPTSLNSANAFCALPRRSAPLVALRRILRPTIKFSTWRGTRIPLKLGQTPLSLPSLTVPPKTRQPPPRHRLSLSLEITSSFFSVSPMLEK